MHNSSSFSGCSGVLWQLHGLLATMSVLRSWPVSVLLATLGGCSVGEVSIGGTDGGNSVCSPRLVTAAAAHAHTPNGATNAGATCETAGCHRPPLGAGAPEFIMSGTAYKPDKTTPATGIELRVVPDAGGAALTSKTDSAGNFYVVKGATNPFPGKALASGCPTADAKMVGALTTATQGNCNSADCHQTPGGAAGAINLADQ